MCFNPCFRGTCSWCQDILAEHAPPMTFQSLFSWNLLLMLNSGRTKSVEMVMFQSLFSWNLLLMFVIRWMIGGLEQLVSILVFVELALDVRNWISGALRTLRFQSLFSWNLLLMSQYEEEYLEHLTKFQSLFSWNLLLMEQYWSFNVASYYVSILVFVELALDDNIKILPKLKQVCFNPCFRGTCSWCLLGTYYTIAKVLFQSLFSWNLLLMIIYSICFGHDNLVSILVFVELALDVCAAFTQRSHSVTFQSLFSWNLLLMWNKRGRLSTGRSSFNPCFRGTCSWCAGVHLLSA